MGRQKGLSDHEVTVDENDHVTTGMINAAVAALRRTTVLLLNQADMGKKPRLGPQPQWGSIGGAVVDHDDFVLLQRAVELLILQCREAFLQNRASVVGRNNDCLLYTSPSPRDGLLSRMPSSA